MTHAATTEAEPAIRWDVIGLLLGAAFVVILNETTMAVALPALMHDLAVDAKVAQWLTTGFMLTMAVVIPTTGYVMNRFSTRTVFLAAMIFFSGGTLLAALAPGFWPLLLARVVQACGTAIMMPLLMTTILELVPIHRRGQVMGLVSVAMSMAPALGPTMSGVILRFGSWRMIFWVMLPIALGMLLLGWLRMTNVGEQSHNPIDPSSVALSAFGFGGLVFALNKVGEPGAETVMIAAFVLAFVALGLFVARQLVLQRAGRPLLDLRTFRHRNFTVAIGLLMIAFMSLMGIVLVWPIYLQQVRGLSTISTGMLLLPGGLAMGLMGPLIGRLHDRFGARVLLVPAAVVMSATILLLSRVQAHSPVWSLLALHVVLSVSLAFVFTPTFTAGLNALPRALYADGSALVGTLQQVAGAAGAALLVTLMSERASALQAAGMPTAPALLSGVHLSFTLAACFSLGAIALAFGMRRTTEIDEDAGADPLAEPTAH